MHNDIPLSSLDFLLVTAMLVVTRSEEWVKVTRTSPSNSLPEDGNRSDQSRGSLSSSNAFPSSSSLSSGIPDASALLHTSNDGGRAYQLTIDGNRSRYAESIDGPASEASSRATSCLSSRADNYSAMQHSAYTSGQGVYAMHSGSSL
jgi:hypothetical protein